MHTAHDFVRPSLPVLRKPRAADGAAIWKLVRNCRPLDENSMYCNLIQCDHFADTCALAEVHGDVVGWVSAYVMPNDPETLFVWQVAVDEQMRGSGLGALMLQSILTRDACEDVRRLQTTITSDNEASWALFRKFGRLQGTSLDVQPYYTQALHFQNRHKTENMVTIPLARQVADAA
ncbi:diaminobutyrate acetyltransferase [Aliiruegeria sabulilitoris]|uniref:diaminobutyrate acetyltransferase n=1 Tax=Aliiruegeria sabulilitoris TaxID=1510458 RepID=UPI0008341CCD|nr:diaminobutyrate acetyltransferase [Aliiruegeria sabulilitoris]NDR56815.1 diaminobutyrate acetyltransferase [Pseudoruegeria sp. M32A2M]